MPDQDKIISKIAKLLELADAGRGGTEAERELATQRAQELMLKYNIEQSELTGGKQSAEGDVGEDGDVISGSMSEWKVMLILNLGKVCFVDGYFEQMARFEWRVVQVGRPENIAFVKTLCEHLIPWLEAEAASGFKQVKEVDADTKPRSFRRAFYAAASARIRQRLEADRKRHMAPDKPSTGQPGTDLVRNEEEANRKYLEAKGVQLRTRRSRGFGSYSGAAMGDAAGGRADITPGRKLDA